MQRKHKIYWGYKLNWRTCWKLYINFNKELFDFFEWNKNDKIIRIKTIPIFKLNEQDLKSIITYNIKLEESFFKEIKEKSTIYNKPSQKRNYALFCDNTNALAVEFNNEGKSINKSSLFISDELEILENLFKLKEKNINYEILNKNSIILKTRKERYQENFIKNELKNIDDKKLKYIYFECFGKQENNNKLIISRLLNLSKESKIYKNLYDILKITSKTIK